MNDLISRQAAIDAIEHRLADPAYQHEGEDWYTGMNCAESELYELPSVQPEQLTDKEQRIFLAAMGREEKVCKEVDAEMTREPYEDSLVRVCHEITRKVKGALWT